MIRGIEGGKIGGEVRLGALFGRGRVLVEKEKEFKRSVWEI